MPPVLVLPVCLSRHVAVLEAPPKWASSDHLSSGCWVLMGKSCTLMRWKYRVVLVDVVGLLMPISAAWAAGRAVRASRAVAAMSSRAFMALNCRRPRQHLNPCGREREQSRGTTDAGWTSPPPFVGGETPG